MQPYKPTQSSICLVPRIIHGCFQRSKQRLGSKRFVWGGVVMLISIIYTCKTTAKSFLFLPGGNARGEQPVICFKHLNFLLPVNIQL